MTVMVTMAMVVCGRGEFSGDGRDARGGDDFIFSGGG